MKIAHPTGFWLSASATLCAALAGGLRLRAARGMLAPPFLKALHTLGAKLAETRLLIVAEHAKKLISDLRARDNELRLEIGDFLRLRAHRRLVEGAAVYRAAQRRLLLPQLLRKGRDRLTAVGENVSHVAALRVGEVKLVEKPRAHVLPHRRTAETG